MMNLRKLWLAALALCVTAGVVSADPIRTLFTKENKFPGAMSWELFLAGGGSSLDDDSVAEDADTYFVAPGARFGLTDRVAIWAAAPFAGFSAGDLDEQGLGDAQAGLEFLFLRISSNMPGSCPMSPESSLRAMKMTGLAPAKCRGAWASPSAPP